MSIPFRALLVVGCLVCLLGVAGVGIAEDPDHEHPDEIDDSADTASVERWLGDRMGEIHADCSEGIKVGNFDACEDLDEEYESMLDRYVEVEGRTDDNETSRAERFNETRQQQAELASLLQEFNTTYEEYREARRQGDEQRARELARELQRLAERIRELGGELEVNLRELDPLVSADLNASANATRETTNEVVRITSEVEQSTFEATNITATADWVATFESPASVTGTVTNEQGEPIADGRVVISDGHRQTVTRTNADGEFTTAYRPTVVETGATNLTVQYVPADDSVHLGSRTNASVRVNPTASAVELTDVTTEAGFGDRVAASGQVRAANTSVPNVRVTISVAGRQLTTTTTDGDGRFEIAAVLPPDIPSGDTTLQVRASRSGRAIGVSRATRPISVQETPTNLSIQAVETSEGLRIQGDLTTETDAPVGNRPLTVALAGEEHEVTTNADGSYELVVDAVDQQGTATVRYDEPVSNLAPSRAETTVGGQGDEGSGAISNYSSNPVDASLTFIESLIAFARESPAIAAVGIFAVLANAVIWPAAWVARREDHPDDDDNEADSDVDETPDEAEEETLRADRGRALLADARDQLERSPEDAVRAGYAAVRAGLDSTEDARTHWEFYQSVGEDLDEERAGALRSVTESFEQAAFAPDGVDAEGAAATLDAAEQCLTATDGGTTD